MQLESVSDRAALVRAQRAANPEGQARKLASAIYPAVLKPFARSFFNRGNLIERRIQANILAERPVQFVGFWGIGGKSQLDKHDQVLLSEYEELREAIRKPYNPAAEITLILADAHGRFNGYQRFEGYLGEVAEEANRRGIASVSLDKLYREWQIQLPDSYQLVDLNSKLWKEFDGSRQKAQLVESAAKHSQAGIPPEQAAYYYWVMRRQEREPLAKSFPNAILFVNGSEDLGRATLPLDMPHLYSRVGPVWFNHG